jgi:hypothetical protein
VCVYIHDLSSAMSLTPNLLYSTSFLLALKEMENIPDSVVGFLLNNLKDFIVYNVGLIRSADEIPNELWRDMEQLKAFVKHCTEENKGNEYLETLVNRIRDTIYDAEDIIEDFVVSSVRKTDLLKRRSLGKELENIRTKLQSLYQNEMPIAREEIRAGQQNTNAERKKKKVRPSLPSAKPRC